MARFTFGMNVSLDGYIDHDRFDPDPVLFAHWTGEVARLRGSLYGRGMYEVMTWWDEDRPEWGPAEQAYARAWRGMHKWVVSTTLRHVGPNATLIRDDVDATLRAIKDRETGEIAVLGPTLADHVSRLGLMDEYNLYVHPLVLGHGKPMFPNGLNPFHLATFSQISPGVVRLTYQP